MFLLSQETLALEIFVSMKYTKILQCRSMNIIQVMLRFPRAAAYYQDLAFVTSLEGHFVIIIFLRKTKFLEIYYNKILLYLKLILGTMPKVNFACTANYFLMYLSPTVNHTDVSLSSKHALEKRESRWRDCKSWLNATCHTSDATMIHIQILMNFYLIVHFKALSTESQNNWCE